MDWSYSGRIDTFRYVRVSGGAEIGVVDGVLDGGTITRNSLSQLKASATIPYAIEPNIGNDLLRVYSTSVFPDGDVVTIAHGTFLVATPTTSYDGEAQTGDMTLYSVLQNLADEYFAESYVVTAGANAVAAAREIAESAGLNVVASESNTLLNSDSVYTADFGTKLTVVNDLLSVAGFGSADVDGYGNVLFSPYVSPANKTASVTFSDTTTKIFDSLVVREYDTFSVPNVVQAIYSSAQNDTYLFAEAVNDNPASEFSTVSKGRRIVEQIWVTDCESLAALQTVADNGLEDKTSAVESYEITHTYVPLTMGDVLNLDYQKASIYRNDLSATTQDMALSPGMICATTVRRFARG